MREELHDMALFAGAGGGVLAGHLLGWRTICAVECDAYAASVLVARQNDGTLPVFPVWDDVQTFDGRPWRGAVDIISGGFPCQDISAAGRGAGLAGQKSGLWFEMLRIVGEVEPAFVFVENSPHLRTKGLGTVLEGLASLGFNAEWDCVSAAEVGAPHRRDRIWILAAHIDRARVWLESWRSRRENWEAEKVFTRFASDPTRDRRNQRWNGDGGEPQSFGPGAWWAAEPDVGRVVYGLANRVDRIRALGNGWIPQVASVAWRRLMDHHIYGN